MLLAGYPAQLWLQMLCLFKAGNRRPGPFKSLARRGRSMLSVLGRPLSKLRGFCALSEATVTMADALAKIPDVEIDPEGTFKYILVRVKVKDGDVQKDIVRGTKSAEYHNHIFDKVNPAMETLGMECKCLGGGKIEHNAQEKKLRVFGESTAFGKADHSVSVEKLKSVFSDYEITWTDDKK